MGMDILLESDEKECWCLTRASGSTELWRRLEGIVLCC